MPAYYFKCSKCGSSISIHRTLDSGVPDAPVCGECQIIMVRDYSFGSVRFSGSGFYSTDKNSG